MDLLIIGVLSLILIPVVAFLTGPLRIVIGLAFVLFFPGYSLLAALMPRKSGLSGIERFALSFGLSLALVALIGLILNYTPWGIRLTTLFGFLIALVFCMLIIGWFRRRLLPQEELFQLNFHLGSLLKLVQWTGQARLNKIITAALFLVIVGAIGTAAYVIAAPEVGERYTEFYFDQPGPQKEDPPRRINPGEKARVPVAIANHEGKEMEYRLEVILDGKNIAEIAPIVLKYGQLWQDDVTFGLIEPELGQSQEAEFLLYKGVETEPYRRLCVWIGETFTDFYIALPGLRNEDSPHMVALGEEARVPVAIVNHEGRAMEYRLEILSDGQRMDMIEPIELRFEMKWEQEVLFDLTKPGHSQKAEFLLYKGMNPEPYRHLNLWIGVEER